jgi:ferredoxin
LSLRAEVDENVCISSGRCVADAPSAFRFDEDEIAHSIDGAGMLGDQQLLDVARNCPSGAIQVSDGDDVVSLW